MSRKRLRRGSEVLVTHDQLDSAVAPSTRVEDRGALLRMLAPLPAKQRAVLVLRYLEDLPDEQIADAVGITPGSVRVLAARSPQPAARSPRVSNRRAISRLTASACGRLGCAPSRRSVT